MFLERLKTCVGDKALSEMMSRADENILMFLQQVIEMGRLAMDRGQGLEDNMNINWVFKKFAHETKWDMVIEKEDDGERFQQVLDNLDKWAEEFQMVYNIDKFHILHLGENNAKYSYTLGGRN